MSSTFALSFHDPDREPNNHNHNNDSHITPAPSVTPNGCDSVSPPPHNHFNTPSYYGPSDISEFDEDPFFGVGVDLSNDDPGHPSFLNGWDPDTLVPNPIAKVEPRRHAADPSYPLTPEQTASIHTASPRSERRAAIPRPLAGRPPASISPQELQKPFRPDPIITQPSQLTPDQSSSSRSSEDGLTVPPYTNMHAHSPRVTVSVWGDNDGADPPSVERSFEDPSPTVRGGIDLAGDLITSSHGGHNVHSSSHDSPQSWQRDPTTERVGLDPANRPSDEVPSINELDHQQKSQERNQEVDRWLTEHADDRTRPAEHLPHQLKEWDQRREDSDESIPLGNQTENRYVPGQVYFFPTGMHMNDQDHEILADNRFGDAPTLHEIRQEHPGRWQSSQDAIAKFERLCRDNDSIISRSATWGTRRRSFPNVSELDMEGVTSGNLFKKLSLSKSSEKTNKSGGLLKELRGFVRRPSISSLRKRRNSATGAELEQQRRESEEEVAQAKRDSIGSPLLAPPEYGSGFGGKKTKPSLNTAIASITGNFAGIGSATAASHPRKTSISGGSISSPRSSLSLSIKAKNTLQRQRSKSELPKPSSTPTPDSANESHPNLVGMWRMSGGPPVAALSRTAPEPEDDDDDDEDYDDDMKAEANLIDDVAPNFTGFQQHILMLNPGLNAHYGYLVDRIAQQQIVRYKNLLNLKVRHLQMGANCPCGQLCVALGGQANILDQRGDAKGLDPLSTGLEDDDEAGTPTEGAINQDSFPQDIPMPPSQYLPAEFECQLCYQRKKFQKPSDWTKHVHEDIQPFTCTWDRCRDAKSFKRKADWVRHENEGHRHLEWWMCDVEECRHTCYRRDNFLQHLVREHKFPEPKHKTKAAIKKAGGLDPTWQKVEQCHILTSKRPQEEPCRFCGKMFPTWKKLTVHLAKHMEQISLPVLRLVAAKAKELAADTIISPVQDPPIRNMIPPLGPEQLMGPYGPGDGQQPMNHGQHHLFHPGARHQQAQQAHGQHPGAYTYPPPHIQQPSYYQPYESMGPALQHPGVSMGGVNPNPGYGHSAPIHDMPVTTASFDHAPTHYMAMSNSGADSGLEPFPTVDGHGLGLHNGTGGPLHVGYNNMIDPSTGHASPFSGQGTVSPYSHSPHLNAGQSDKGWDDRQSSGYL